MNITHLASYLGKNVTKFEVSYLARSALLIAGQHRVYIHLLLMFQNTF